MELKTTELKTSDYSFELPEELVAQYPLGRGDSRLLVYSRAQDTTLHSTVRALPQFLEADSLIVVNNTSVRKARILAENSQARVCEFLFLRPLGYEEETQVASTSAYTAVHHAQNSRLWSVLIGRARQQKIGQLYQLPGKVEAELLTKHEGLAVIRLSEALGTEYFQRYGRVPLPPYIHRSDRADDEEDYQTIFAKEHGSVAAPTAGLHLSTEILQDLKKKGIRICEITLHVGIGTFLPVRSEYIRDHIMHSEEYEISPESAQLINDFKQRGRPVIAVGTTSLRCLEAAWQEEAGRVEAGIASTNLFIYGGYEFKLITALFTNFHTPRSTLLMLVSAFVGREKILSLYKEAVDRRYRFFSYGDACLFL